MDAQFNAHSSPEQYWELMDTLLELSVKLQAIGFPIALNEGDTTQIESVMKFIGYEEPLPGVKFAVCKLEVMFLSTSPVIHEIPEHLQEIRILVIPEEIRLY